MKSLFFLLLSSSLFASFPSEVSGPILYRMHRGECEKAMNSYLEHSKLSGEDDFELLQEACLRLLDSGMKSSDLETQLMCMLGSGIAANPSLLPVLQKGIESKEGRIQVVALHYLADLQHDDADLLLIDALSSPFLLTRLEAAFELAQKKEGSVVEQLAQLFYKMPPEARPLLAQIAAPLATPAATRFFEQLLSDQSKDVRLAATIEAGLAGRDDLIPRLRHLANQPDIALQEAAIQSLGSLMDEESKPLFHQLVEKRKDHLRLVSLQALFELGEFQILSEIEKEAKEKNLFAIIMLGAISKDEKTQETLLELASSSDPLCRLNGAWALLESGKLPPLACLKAMLIKDEYDTGFMKQYSPGKSLTHWVAVSGVKSLEKIYPNLGAETLQFRSQILKRTLDLPEAQFLQTARLIFDHHQYDLVPLLIELLINHRSENAVALLKEMQQKAGAPLIRNYCTLALYRLNIEGPYEETLLKWVKDEKNHPIIRFREEKREKKNPSRYEFTPEETSQFLISAFETLATKQNQKGREALIHAIANGNEKNKYALAGLLMRMIE